MPPLSGFVLCLSLLPQVRKLEKGEMLMVNIGSTSTGGRVLAVKADLCKIKLLQVISSCPPPFPFQLCVFPQILSISILSLAFPF